MCALMKMPNNLLRFFIVTSFFFAFQVSAQPECYDDCDQAFITCFDAPPCNADVGANPVACGQCTTDRETCESTCDEIPVNDHLWVFGVAFLGLLVITYLYKKKVADSSLYS